jgi:adenylate cyclase
MPEGSLICWKRAEPDNRRRIARRVVGHLQVFVPLTNLVGSLLVFAYFGWAFPPVEDRGAFATTSVNAIAGVIYFVLVAALSNWRARRAEKPLMRWQIDDSPPTEAERTEVLNIPKQMAVISAQNWAGAIPLFFVLNLDYSLQLAFEVAGSIVLAGLATSAAAYLVAERLSRPALGYVLDPRAGVSTRSLGVAPRIVLTWALLSGIPLIAIALIPIGRVPDDPQELLPPIVFVVGVALIIGLLGMKAVAHAISRPVRDLRRALDDVGEGRTDIEVEVNDASEIGRLQAGFNQMVEGLRERERLRDLFGKHVGNDVAREALERGVSLGGQQKTVAALFVDVVGSTALAGRERPERVVELLNGFFQLVVETTAKHGGFVNKFEGDGAVCVFGAPVELDGFAGAALAAARELRTRLDESSPVDAAIGVSCGVAVAGNVGAEERYEYTVIGDPVNEASRLCELAKNHSGRILASSSIVEQAGAEARHWVIDGEVKLRGRVEPTRLAFPREFADERAVEEAGVTAA